MRGIKIMSEIIDVYTRIKYKKDNVIKDDDILDDLDIYSAILELEYDVIVYKDEKLLTLQSRANYSYARTFSLSEERNELQRVAKSKGIDNLYYIFCSYSLSMGIIYGVINFDIKNNAIYEKIFKEEDCEEILEKLSSELVEKFQMLNEGEKEYTDDGENLDDIVEEMNDKISKYCYQEFIKFINETKLEELDFNC
ncbi:hypothetical protein GCWU000323_00033 [Leptotrichia hofstadii F0254]|uniref:Uncharacterized protein n=2 Tax=Leptotrichia hofstadii TaxID=157688 RepID=C9MU15_9FUSO|nr:hypothetical protein GCWU000323_00033 [Leptotrichia hofstadii F0254]